MRYVEARLEDFLRDETYRIYVTQSLQLIPQSKFVSMTYHDMINGKKEDKRSGDEIALDIIQRAGLKFG